VGSSVRLPAVAVSGDIAVVFAARTAARRYIARPMRCRYSRSGRRRAAEQIMPRGTRDEVVHRDLA
jgi:hypothetical protein